MGYARPQLLLEAALARDFPPDDRPLLFVDDPRERDRELEPELRDELFAFEELDPLRLRLPLDELFEFELFAFVVLEPDPGFELPRLRLLLLLLPLLDAFARLRLGFALSDFDDP